MDLLSQIREGGILYILLLIAITMHEFGHAFIADKLGDPMPRADGRVTINPVAHIDTMGTVILPLLTIALSMGTGFPMVFGWGKPVQVQLANPKTRAKVDILSTMGGVSMNLVVALISAILLAVFAALDFKDLASVAVTSIYLNCVLFVINMIPVPPLDGSVFLKYFTKISPETYYTIARWGIVILIALINIPLTSRAIMMCVQLLATIFFAVSELVIRIF